LHAVRSSSLDIISITVERGEKCVGTALAKASDDKLTEVLQKASSGDQSVLPELRRLLDQGPELPQLFGDMGRRATTAWIDLATGDNLLRREALTRQVAVLEREIAGPSPSVLERLLAERIVVCWLELNYLELALTSKGERPLRQAEYYDRRKDRAHRRYLSAIRSLATIRRLVIPALQVNIGAKQVNVAGTSV